MEALKKALFIGAAAVLLFVFGWLALILAVVSGASS